MKFRYLFFVVVLIDVVKRKEKKEEKKVFLYFLSLYFFLSLLAPAASAEELQVGDLDVPDLPRLQVERHEDLDLQAVAEVVVHEQRQRRRLPAPRAPGRAVPEVVVAGIW